MNPLDQVVFSTDSVVAAKFRCSLRDPRFKDSGPAGHHAVTFPRTSVWIKYAGSPSFVADPTISTIYNPGQKYTRSELSSDGDRCDWLAVSPGIAREITETMDPGARDRADKIIARQLAPVDRRLYIGQRRFFTLLERREVDPLDAEETIVAYVAAVLRSAYGATYLIKDHRATDAHRDLVQRARAEIAKSVGDHVTLNQLASRLGVSAFHLCRVFRKRTGLTLHAFRLELRLRIALERLADSRADLSSIALDLGFSSHSHFSALLRRSYGKTPSALRQLVSGACGASS